MQAEDFTNELFTNISALQKSVRRGLVEDALYYANTLMTSSAGGKKIVVTKILTYLVEDIGFANLFLAKPIVNIFGLD
jgi:replication-associated recombination protein RarA